MFPCILLCTSSSDNTRKKRKPSRAELRSSNAVGSFSYFDSDPVFPTIAARFSPHLRSGREVKEIRKKRGEMAANKVSSFSDLIQRVAANCLLHPLAAGRGASGEEDEEASYGSFMEIAEEEEEAAEGEIGGGKVYNAGTESEAVMWEVFEAVAAMKKAYVRLQEAHCPWDPQAMRAADVAVVGELRRLAVLRERFKRGKVAGGGGRRVAGGLVREMVAPYEAAVDELRMEVKVKEAEVENLKEALKRSVSFNGNGDDKKNGRGQFSRRKVGCSSISAGQVASSPAPELFEATMNQVKETSKSFTSVLLTLMRAAHWDIAAAVRSIEAATSGADELATAHGISVAATSIPSTIALQHAKYALESYISRKIFQGFDHETFYMDGSLSSLLNPDQFRRDCFTQFRDMKAMDPTELLGILPTCHFGKFCSKKFLGIVHPKMEESLFGNLEQRQLVVAGNHPRSQFYEEFLGMAKAVWLLHLLAFSLDPAPSQFEASRGAKFHRQYMESVVKFSSGRVPAGQIVGFPVSPGFKLSNGPVIKARVYLVPRA